MAATTPATLDLRADDASIDAALEALSPGLGASRRAARRAADGDANDREIDALRGYAEGLESLVAALVAPAVPRG